MIRVGVLGAAGRMGSETCAAVDADPELELVARVGREDSLTVLSQRSTEVAVDFTVAGAVKDNVRFLLEHGIHAVVGTTGLGNADLEEIARWAGRASANAIVAPNFAVGAVLMMRFAAAAAPYFDTAEIVERHHENKADAPSGTALATAGAMNAARNEPWITPTKGSDALEGSRGGDARGIRVHSLRVPGSVAHQEVILGSRGQTLTIRHDSVDRSSFMPGVLLAIKRVGSVDGLTVGLERVLDL